MSAMETPEAAVGSLAPDFKLPGVDGKEHSLASIKGPKGLLVVFICNHCPYVKAQLDRIARDAAELKKLGVNTVAISSNDAANYPEDSFENMKKLAAEKSFSFPYLYDETQDVAKAYGAVCTPDFFGYNADLELQYRGRLDESWSLTIKNPKRELFEAMKEVAETGKAPSAQVPSIGCSIKWKTASVAAAARG